MDRLQHVTVPQNLQYHWLVLSARRGGSIPASERKHQRVPLQQLRCAISPGRFVAYQAWGMLANAMN